MYQLPAIYLREIGIRAISIVISPLISLMKDQVSSLRAKGVSANMICSTTSRGEEQDAMNGLYCVLYLSPEKLSYWKSSLIVLSKTYYIVCIAIDEAHCVR